MATPAQLPMASQRGLGELWARLRFLLLAIVIYRIGTHVPVPGLDPERIAQMYKENEGTILGMVNMFSGGALERMSILALGIMPYISASIIMQLLSAVTPSLEQLKKEGDAGRRKINQMTRYLTLALASVQALALAVGFSGYAYGDVGFHFYAIASISLVTGAMFMMWLGEQVTERGVGNGISMLIFAGIVAGIPSAIGQTFSLARSADSVHMMKILVVCIIAIAVIWVVVRVERGQRRITINYAKRQPGRQAQASHLPLKINMAGVIPAIFASSILMFPASIGQWFGSSATDSEWSEFLGKVSVALSPGNPLYIIVFVIFIVFFCFFYTALMFNPKEVAENLKKSGAFIPGIRPGEHSAKYIDSVLTRLTVIGGMYMSAVCLLPEFLIVSADVPFYLGGTSLLIVVVVVMDFMSQVQAHLMSHQYESLMKKSNLKGYGATGLR
ncbi:MAG: preprotein translocase subunit SecY [Cellvibrio sp.]|nr:preprotein translocase subunit SecY [Cellvibrio sp.]